MDPIGTAHPTAIEEMFGELAVELQPLHWSHGLPDIFAVDHSSGSLDEEAARELIDRYDANGRRPEDLIFLRQFFAQHRDAFNMPAYFSMQRFVEEAPLLTGPSWVARVKDGRQMTPVEVPSLADLLGQRIGSGAFSRILEHVQFLWYRGDLAAMAQSAEVETLQLEQYVSGLQLPHRYDQVVRLAHRLGLDADALGYAWIAELRQHFKLDLEDDPVNALSRAQVLSEAAGLRLGRLPVNLTGHLSLGRVVETIRQALAAGMDEHAVYAVFTELCAQHPKLIDNISLQAAQVGRRRRVERGLIALRLGSLALQSQGELTRAALLEAQAGDTIGQALRDGRLSGDACRGQRVRHYEEALRLYENSGGGNTLWTNEAFARRVEQELARQLQGDDAAAADHAQESAWYAARPAFSSPELSPVVQVVWPEQRWSGYVNPPAGERATLEFVEGVGYVPLPKPSLAVIASAAAMVPFKAR